MKIADWQWDELQQVGTDYTDLAQVRAYDERMAVFREVGAENREMLGQLGLPRGAAVLEIGCGTGRFARAAAAAGMVVTAIDVSAIMLVMEGLLARAGFSIRSKANIGESFVVYHCIRAQ